MAKIKLDKAYLVAYPSGQRQVKGPGDVDSDELPEDFRKRLQARQKATRGKNRAGTPLPGDFPQRRALEAAGIRSLEELQGKSSDDLRKIEGIGQRNAELIRQAASGKATTNLQDSIGQSRQEPEPPKGANGGRKGGGKQGGSTQSGDSNDGGGEGGDQQPPSGDGDGDNPKDEE